MRNHLKITADLEDDGTVGLTATVSFEEFSGSGEAWFNITEVKQFISELEHFAQTSEAPPELTGGIWDGEGIYFTALLHLFSFPCRCFGDVSQSSIYRLPPRRSGQCAT